MQIVYERCCGLDVHKKSVVACVLITGEDGTVQREVRTYATMTADLLMLRDWLESLGIQHVAMESTGVFWHPIYNILEDDHRTIILVNAQHMKAVPGRKTDVKDSEWLADLLRHGLLKASFIPPSPIRELRELTCYRKTLVQQRASEINRLQKVLESANLKLAAVATDILGKSGRDMLDALVSGQEDPEVLAALARGRLRAKIPELQRALEGRVKAHHRFLIEQILSHIDFLDQAILKVYEEVEHCLAPFLEAVTLLETIPCINAVTAAVIVAEIGIDMSRFPSAKHLASWAGVVRCITRLNIPGTARKNSKGGSWVNGLPHIERSWGTVACH
ncbi:IS110 family transposase [Reticulibacter mediterranei]|uniref:IS110 family transposase n=1 Tax=Reticulibacter mediterranei TaxID=2778369 RepID=A0A8J3IN03_9CHLR|nr:IS110 family transposase [Reticulibacter mediterranei]GHO97541.1 IS110 family transposase [Reticulibacter mediterranei]